MTCKHLRLTAAWLSLMLAGTLSGCSALRDDAAHLYIEERADSDENTEADSAAETEADAQRNAIGKILQKNRSEQKKREESEPDPYDDYDPIQTRPVQTEGRGWQRLACRNPYLFRFPLREPARSNPRDCRSLRPPHTRRIPPPSLYRRRTPGLFLPLSGPRRPASCVLPHGPVRHSGAGMPRRGLRPHPCISDNP